jgi:hypothetical protein
MVFTPCKVGDFWITPLKKISFRFPLTKYNFLDSPLKSTTWQLTVPESPRGRRNLHHVGNFQLKKNKNAMSFNKFFLFFLLKFFN